MKTMKKRHLLTILTALLFSAVSTAVADTPCDGYYSCGDGTNLYYKIDGTTVLFCSPDPDANAVIPNSAFKNNSTITSFVIPDNVTQIGSQAFMNCTALTSIDLANVKVISTSAFEGCTALTEVVIPPTVTNIGVQAFYGCSSLQTVLCRPQAPPALASTDPFTSCHSSLQICVSALGEYRSATYWSNYYDNFLLCYLDENDEQDVASAKIEVFRDAERNEISVFRTLRKAGCFNTLTLPFSVPDINNSPLAGAEVYTFTSAKVVAGTLMLDIERLTGSGLTAGTPYLIQWANTGEVLKLLQFEGITEWTTKEATVAPISIAAESVGTGAVTYNGFYGKTHIDDAKNNELHLNLFLMGNNQLYWPTDGEDSAAKMLGFRAYFHIDASGSEGAPIRRGMPAQLNIRSTPTDLQSADETETNNTKILRNGQLYIMHNGEMYNLQGQKMQEGGQQ